MEPETKSVIRKRFTIPAKVRYEVWRKYCGNTLDGRCFCCQGDILFESWYCDHITADKYGGLPTVYNLRPLCPRCNWEMSIMNMYDFTRKKNLTGIIHIETVDWDYNAMEIDNNVYQ